MSGKKLEQYGGGGGLGVCPVRGGGAVDLGGYCVVVRVDRFTVRVHTV